MIAMMYLLRAADLEPADLDLDSGIPKRFDMEHEDSVINMHIKNFGKN